MSKLIDLSGMVFGHLTVISYHGPSSRGAVWVCRCSCGTVKNISAANMKSGGVRSCGCQQYIRASESQRKHGRYSAGVGFTNHPSYRTWAGMIGRCTDPNHPSYKHYGSIGITVCERWMVFKDFVADMGERPTKEHSLDRIDSSKGYEPSNCRWATACEQANNKSNNVRLTVNGETKTQAQWTQQMGFTTCLISDRLEAGWSVEDAVLTPARRKAPNGSGEQPRVRKRRGS